jgi:hypothetical protein
VRRKPVRKSEHHHFGRELDRFVDLGVNGRAARLDCLGY